MKTYIWGLLRYLGLMFLVSGIGWLVWNQYQMHMALELYQLHLEQLTAEVAQANQPNSSRDEIKHYQQLAYLILNEPSDLELGEAYLNILITEYLNQKAMTQVQQTQILIKEIQTLKQQVAHHVSLLNTLQMDLLTPSNKEATWTPAWLQPWRDWVKLEVSQNPSADIDPQRWRYWSTIELAKWYLVHGHYADYANTIQYLAKWTHVYPAGLVWDDALGQLMAPLQTLDLSSVKPSRQLSVDEHKALKPSVIPRPKALPAPEATKPKDAPKTAARPARDPVREVMV